MATHNEAFKSFFNTPDGTRDWAGGTLTKKGNIATYTGADGTPFSFSANSNPLDIAAANKGIADQWAKNWGFDWDKEYQTAPTNSFSLFGQDLSKFNGPMSQSGSSSVSQSYSGLDPGSRDELIKTLLPELMGQIGNLDSNIDKYTSNAVSQARGSANNVLKEMLPQYLDQMSAKGMINSDTGKDALSKAMDSIARDASNKTYSAGMEAAKMKFSIPEMLSRVGDLAKYSQSGGSSSSSSKTSNDMAGFELLLKALMGA